MLWPLLLLVSASTPLQPATPELAVKDRWLVVLQNDVAAERVKSLASEIAGARVISVWQSAVRAFLVEIPDAEAGLLTQHPMVRQVVQDRRLPQPFSAPISDCFEGVASTGASPSLPETITCADPDPQNPNGVCTDNWGLDRLDGPTITRDGRYNPPRTGQGVHIFIIDTGLYAQHQDFSGRVGQGFDATASDGLTTDCANWSHGTHVAGIAAGTRFGVAKGATLHSVRVATCPTNIQLSWLVAAYDWVAQVHTSTITGPAVVSMSINAVATDFSDPTSLLNTAITGVINSGVLVVESAGNNLEDACSHVVRAPGVLIAGGSDEFDTPWERRIGDPNFGGWCTSGGDCGTNNGACVSLFAPAAHIVSTWYGMAPDPKNICRLSGTSMAAPHVAGVAALYLQANPAATPAQVKQALVDQARPVLTQLSAGSPNKLISLVDPQPSASISPLTLGFGVSPLMQTTAPKSVTVTSTGTKPLHVTNAVVTGAGFQLSTNGCTTVTTSCGIAVTFAPPTTGKFTGSLTFSTDDPANTNVTVSLTGDGAGEDPKFTVTLAGTGKGSVVSTPAGISCGTTCTASFAAGTAIEISAVPEAGSVFAGWGAGLCSNAKCNVVLVSSMNVTATFSRPGTDAGPVVVPADAGLATATPDGGTGHIEANGSCGCSALEGHAIVLMLLLVLKRSRASV